MREMPMQITELFILELFTNLIYYEKCEFQELFINLCVFLSFLFVKYEH